MVLIPVTVCFKTPSIWGIFGIMLSDQAKSPPF